MFTLALMGATFFQVALPILILVFIVLVLFYVI